MALTDVDETWTVRQGSAKTPVYGIFIHHCTIYLHFRTAPYPPVSFLSVCLVLSCLYDATTFLPSNAVTTFKANIWVGKERKNEQTKRRNEKRGPTSRRWQRRRLHLAIVIHGSTPFLRNTKGDSRAKYKISLLTRSCVCVRARSWLGQGHRRRHHRPSVELTEDKVEDEFLSRQMTTTATFKDKKKLENSFYFIFMPDASRLV